jgi:shikimate kinase
MNLILFGFKSCGKTTLGKMIAIRMNRPFFDTDNMLEQLHYQWTGDQLHFREIYKKIGEDAFRKLESDVVQQLKGIKNAIIALGGGLILDPKNTAFLAKLGQLIYLKVSKETLKRRILSKELPSFLNPADPEGSFEQFYNERRAKYEAVPAISVDLETKTQDQVVLELSALILNVEESHGQ